MKDDLGFRMGADESTRIAAAATDSTLGWDHA